MFMIIMLHSEQIQVHKNQIWNDLSILDFKNVRPIQNAIWQE